MSEFGGTERFAIVRRIGAGGMGEVYEAFDRERETRVALKTLPRVEPAALYRFKNEFRQLTGVAHPNLATLYELHSTGEEWFFTMELIDGVDFLHYVRRGHGGMADTAGGSDEPTEATAVAEKSPDPGPLTGSESPTLARPHYRLAPAELARLRSAATQLATGVSALHEAGKLHRDIKPSNVLVSREGRVVLLDFGLAVELGEEEGEQAAEKHIVGTVAYMAPEQAAGQPLSNASDWYSVGAMLYEALTGRRPFAGGQAQVLLDKQRLDPRPPSALVDGIPPDLERLCLEMLKRRPEDRPTGGAVRARLGGHPVVADPLPAPGPKAPFVGRERHLDGLRRAFTSVRRGQTATVSVHGPSGAGKSMLVQRFLEELEAGGEAVVLRGRCWEEESVPYKALDNLVDGLSRFLRRLGREEAAALMPRDVGALARVFPVLQRVEAVSEAPQRNLDLPDRQESRRRAFAALRELLARIGDRHPLVLLIDDLQWGDVDSAALISDILRPPDPPCLLLLVAYRSEHASTSPSLKAFTASTESLRSGLERHELPVEPLDPEESRGLARLLLGSGGAGARADVIARESGGLPYFVHELVQSLFSGAEVGGDTGSGQAITLDEVLWRRVLGLPRDARRLLEIVAVSGRPLAQSDACRAAGLGAPDPRVLTLLRSGHFVRGTGSGEKDEVETYHDRIRETVVSRLSPGARRAHHRQLAVTLEESGGADPEALALHFDGADEPTAAGEYYARAADAAAESLAFARAARLYRRSLELRPPEGEPGRGLRMKLADALANAGRGAEAAREYLAAADGAEREAALEAQRRAAYQYCISGHVDEGRVVLRRLLRQVGLGLPETRLSMIGTLLLQRARLRLRGLRFREREAARVPRPELIRSDIIWTASAGLSMFDLLAGAQFQTRSLLQALRTGEPSRIARGLAWEAVTTSNAGLASRSRTEQLLHAARELAERIQDPHALAMATMADGIAEFMLAHWTDACGRLEQAEEIFRAHCTGVAWELDTTHAFTLWALVYQGEFAEVGERGARLLKEARERGDLNASTTLGTFVLPHVRLAADDPSRARATVEESLVNWSQEDYHLQHLTALMSQIYIDLYEGRGEAGLHRLEEEWGRVRQSFLLQSQVLRTFLIHLRARSALAAAGTADRAGRLRRAERDAGRIEREGTPWSMPMASLIRGLVAAARGQAGEACDRLERAAEGFDRFGMGSYASAARRRHGELLGGARGRDLAEEAHAWLAARGVSDPERMTRMHAPLVTA